MTDEQSGDGKIPRAPRYRTRGMEVTCSHGDGLVFSGPVLDGSATGVFISTEEQLEVGALVHIQPEERFANRLRFEIKGKVVRQDENLPRDGEDSTGLALELLELTSEQTERFLSCLVAAGTRVR